MQVAVPCFNLPEHSSFIIRCQGSFRLRVQGSCHHSTLGLRVTKKKKKKNSCKLLSHASICRSVHRSSVSANNRFGFRERRDRDNRFRALGGGRGGHAVARGGGGLCSMASCYPTLLSAQKHRGLGLGFRVCDVTPRENREGFGYRPQQ